jgi:RimK family alpha-L-glutamate ligase
MTVLIDALYGGFVLADTTPDTSQSTEATTSERSLGNSSGVTDSTRRVGVLSTHNSKETKAILNAVRALGHEPVWIRDENVSSWIADGSVRFSPAVDVLVNRLLVTKSDRPLEDLQLAAMFDETVPVLNPPGAVRDTLHKYRAGVRLVEAGLPVPDAYFGRAPRTFEDWNDHLPGRAAHKRTVGTNGHKMAVVSSGDAVSPRIEGGQSFVQEFLETDDGRPSDVRVYVVDDRVVGAMRRRAPDGEWRTNVALGGETADVTDELGDAPRRIAVEAADALGLDVVGVDLMPADGTWYVLEVNATAGFRGLYDATGTSPAPHIAALAVERADGTVARARVRELASTLDDSVPDCKPSLDRPASGDEILGYTTRVTVAGNDGGTAAVAKADTGARRTSLDTELAVGAGPLVGTTEVRTTASAGTETRPLIDVNLRVNGRWRTVTASVADRSEMRYPVLLGRDVLEEYRLDISRRVEE